MNRERVGWFGLLILALAASCSSGPKPDCSADLDCGPHHICLEGTCRDLQAPCNLDAHCLAGQVCSGGICASACQGDHQCPQGSWCDAGHCLPGCSSDADCPIGSLCTPASHTCDPGCRIDAHCLMGERCRDGQCEEPECLSDADCLAPTRCSDGDCLVPSACQADGDCLQGQRCRDGACQDPECVLDADCQAGQVCAQGWCEARTGCASDMDCPLGQSCQAGQCEDIGCSNDSDCPAGQHCLDAGCYGQECLSDAHCPQGQFCSLGTCQCDPLAQACGPGERCAFDDSNTPVCAPAGDGSQCFAGGLDDCPAGMQCATADNGLSFDCYDLCLLASGAGCGPYYSCVDAGLPSHGLCLGDCHPLRQDCGGGYKCTIDEYGSPICYWNAGSGSQCLAGTDDDCPAGQVCADAGAGFGCHALCIAYNGIGCGQAEDCLPLDGSAHWGACVAGKCCK